MVLSVRTTFAIDVYHPVYLIGVVDEWALKDGNIQICKEN
jgi:hypothetical protein